ncbi:hypothetical protein Bca4012_062569 [Brassica carinata]
MEVKQKLSKQKLLDRLLAKKDPLTEMEASLKLKLMSEMCSCRTCEPSHGCICESVLLFSSCESKSRVLLYHSMFYKFPFEPVFS